MKILIDYEKAKSYKFNGDQYSIIPAIVEIAKKKYSAEFMYDISIPEPDKINKVLNSTERKILLVLVDNTFDLSIRKLEDNKLSISSTTDSKNYEIISIEEFRSLIKDYWRQIEVLKKRA